MRLARVLLATLICSMSCGAIAQAFPVKPVRLVLRSPPGGTDDLLGRLLAQKMPDTLGQQVIVDYRTGAGGLVAWEIVARSPPDGYTLFLAASGLGAVKSLRPDATIDPWRDYTWVSQVVNYQLMLVAHPTLPVKTVKDLIALARSRPGQLSYGSSGIGATPHLVGEYFKAAAKVNIVHVPYKGAGPAVMDLVGGHVQLMIIGIPVALPQVRNGRLKTLGVTTLKRSAAAPDIPTLNESGLPGYEVLNWYGIIAPAKTPREVVTKVSTELRRMLHAPDMRPRLQAQGFEPAGTTPEEFDAYIQSELAKWTKVVRQAGIKPD
jgi:tripartite-type tricarboxylate transporter receptor subunit TctC